MGYISQKYEIDPEKVVKMIRDGVIDWRIEGLYNFYKLYYDLLEVRGNKRDAREEIMMHFKIERWTFYRYLTKAKILFDSSCI